MTRELHLVHRIPRPLREDHEEVDEKRMLLIKTVLIKSSMSNGDRIKTLRSSAFWLFSLMILLTSVIVIIYIVDINIPIINEEVKHSQLMHLFYPVQSTTNIPLTRFDPENQGLAINNTENLSVDILIQYNGILSEGKPVSVTAMAWLYPKGESTITSLVNPEKKHFAPGAILVGFEGATAYGQRNEYYGSESEFPITPQKQDRIAYFNTSQMQTLNISQNIIWDAQGDYSPYLVIPSINHALVVTYPNYKVHVNGRDAVMQEKYAKISVVLTIVLFLFTIVTSLEILFKIYPDKVLKLLGVQQNPESGHDKSSNDTQKITNTEAQNSDKNRHSKHSKK